MAKVIKPLFYSLFSFQKSNPLPGEELFEKELVHIVPK